jgi:hypothetical protein
VFIDDIKNIKQYLKGSHRVGHAGGRHEHLRVGKMIDLDIDSADMLNFTMTHDEKLAMFMKGTVS